MIMPAKSALSTLTCRLLVEADFPAWDRFVERHPQASVYHLSIWRHILGAAFGKRWYLIAALQDGTIRAGLPLVHMQSRLFGNFLVSMPYVNYGGLLAEDTALAGPVLREAVALGQQLGARHLELRHLDNHYPQLPVCQEKGLHVASLTGYSSGTHGGLQSQIAFASPQRGKE